jgi:hypothetical protein
VCFVTPIKKEQYMVDMWEIGRGSTGLSLADFKIANVVHLLRGVLDSLPYQHKQVVGGDINNIVLYDVCVIDSQEWPCATQKAILFLEAYDKLEA